MKTISLEIDHATWIKAQQKAEALATSVDQVIRDYVRHWATEENAIDEARRLMTARFAHPDWEFAVGTPDDRELRNARR
jgi:hypothetical protein